MRCDVREHGEKKTQESDMKISFRCFFDRMRCVCAKSGDENYKMNLCSSFTLSFHSYVITWCVKFTLQNTFNDFNVRKSPLLAYDIIDDDDYVVER